MKVIKIIIFLLFATAFLIFILENFKTLSQPMRFVFDLKFWGVESQQLPLGFYFFIVFLAGFIFGFLFMAFRKFKRKV